MIIFLQCAGIVNILVILISFFVQKKVYLRGSKMFIIFAIETLICLILDALSLVAIAYTEIWGETLVKIFCRIYLASVIFSPSCALVYISIDVFKKMRNYILVGVLAIVFGIIGSVLVSILPLDIVRMTDTDVTALNRYLSDYSEGPAVLTTYIFAVGFVLAIIAVLIIKRNHINSKKFASISVWISAWIIAALTQFINNQIIVVGFGLSIGITMIYMNIENPALSIDKITGAFNQGALSDYLNYLYQRNVKFDCFMMSFSDQQKELLTDRDNYLLIKLHSYLKRNTSGRVFITDERNFCIVNNVLDYSSSANISKIKIDFYGSKNPLDEKLLLNPKFVLLKDPYIVSNPKDILGLIDFAMDRNDSYVDGIIIVDKSHCEKFKQNDDVVKLIYDAIEEDLFKIFLQPIYSMKKGKFTSMEALVRIVNKEGKVVSPGVFIPVAETTGSIIRIGEIVFEKVCQFIKSNNMEELGIDYIEVNLSVVQCAQPTLADRLITIMKVYNINPKYINFEITESASDKSKEVIHKNIEELLKFGVSFSLDDFGTGNSNLNYIIDMPVKIVKFDKMMVDSYFDSDKAKYIMDSSIRMLKDLKYEIVLEGVESDEQVLVCSNLNIDYIQGFYYSKPLPVNDCLTFLKEYNK